MAWSSALQSEKVLSATWWVTPGGLRRGLVVLLEQPRSIAAAATADKLHKEGEGRIREELQVDGEWSANRTARASFLAKTLCGTGCNARRSSRWTSARPSRPVWCRSQATHARSPSRQRLASPRFWLARRAGTRRARTPRGAVRPGGTPCGRLKVARRRAQGARPARPSGAPHGRGLPPAALGG